MRDGGSWHMHVQRPRRVSWQCAEAVAPCFRVSSGHSRGAPLHTTQNTASRIVAVHVSGANGCCYSERGCWGRFGFSCGFARLQRGNEPIDGWGLDDLGNILRCVLIYYLRGIYSAASQCTSKWSKYPAEVCTGLST